MLYRTTAADNGQLVRNWPAGDAHLHSRPIANDAGVPCKYAVPGCQGNRGERIAGSIQQIGVTGHHHPPWVGPIRHMSVRPGLWDPRGARTGARTVTDGTAGAVMLTARRAAG